MGRPPKCGPFSLRARALGDRHIRQDLRPRARVNGHATDRPQVTITCGIQLHLLDVLEVDLAHAG
jgi:hypothetical protein